MNYSFIILPCKQLTNGFRKKAVELSQKKHFVLHQLYETIDYSTRDSITLYRYTRYSRQNTDIILASPIDATKDAALIY